MRFFAVIIACGMLTVSPSFSQESKVPATKISHFSGKPVPRFESLKFPAAHGRMGPSLDHPIVWKYERAGLPMLILKESQDWRFVRDPDGDEVWVHTRMLSGDRTALLRQETTLKREPDDQSRSIALIEPGVVAQLNACAGAWCEIVAQRYRGYVPRRILWGGDENEAGL